MFLEVSNLIDNGQLMMISIRKVTIVQTIGMIQILEVLEDIKNMIHQMEKEL